MCSAVNNMNRVHTAALTNIHVSAAVLISTLCNSPCPYFVALKCLLVY